MKKRRWKEWIPNTVRELNESSGVVGIVGIVTTAAGAAAAAAIAAAPFIIGAGIVTTVASVGWAVYEGVPEECFAPAPGQTFSLQELGRMNPRPCTFGLFGSSGAGKSTLLNEVRSIEHPGRTERLYACLFALPDGRNIASIDGAGQDLPQQFTIADEADALIIVLDHADTAVGTSMVKSRLKQHEQQLEQLRYHLQKSGRKYRRMHFVLNKQDLWGKRKKYREPIENWFNGIVLNWKTGGWAEKTTGAQHSNNYAKCINQFRQLLSEIAGMPDE